VAILHRRQTIGPIGSRVFVVPNPDQRRLEQTHDDGEDALA
jgi:hypothetical protein